MKKIAMVVHGGASERSRFLENNETEVEKGLKLAVQCGYQILQKGGSALDAVEAAVRMLEDDPLFNAGRGSALNCNGEVEMDASIMDGANLKAGAVSMVREVKHPISLVRAIMNQTDHVFLSGYGALAFAKKAGLDLAPASYFMTEHQYADHQKACERETQAKKKHGTVGAVALDSHGNLAAGTSTGGTNHSLPGRIGDSCVIGAGCYANNKTCGVSSTGDGEYIITGVIAHTISMMMELKNMTMQAACDEVLHTRNAGVEGVIGVISIAHTGEIGMSFTGEVMKRAWMSSDQPLQVKIY
jgi:beta-aspartyl-peptidase (threonine type)